MIYDNLNLKVQQGKITAIMGPSGIRETSLLRLIGGQLYPEQGEILFDGQDIVVFQIASFTKYVNAWEYYSNQGALFTDIFHV